MIIRCEQCSTLYELDEALLAPEGSEVQCARCRHVFTARPSSAPGQTMVGVPPVDGQGATRPAVLARSPAERVEQAAVASVGGGPARPTPPRASVARSSLPAVYHPPPGSSPTASAAPRSPLVRGDAIGAFENRLRWSHRWRWLAPALAAVVVVVAVLGWLSLSGRLRLRGRHGSTPHGAVARPPAPPPSPGPAPARAPSVAPAAAPAAREPNAPPPVQPERAATSPRKAEAPPAAPGKEPAAGTRTAASRTAPGTASPAAPGTAGPAAPGTAGPAVPGTAGPGEPVAAPAEAEPAVAPQRLRPAAVPAPEPEPAQGEE